ncbi:MAG: heavy metal translocating P-type ATPase [Verrucomicrobia bacterium]|nr:MAG: heavy metal translocating P-type ATPase [Verrucomicrobiota bacterium]
MRPATTPTPAPDKNPEACLARSVIKVLAEDRALEAVTINRDSNTVSVATLGQADVPKLTERISASIQRARQVQDTQKCGLLDGEVDCQRCEQPLSNVERERITIHHEGPSTTIARVTCPTAPKFWRWRDIPLPKVVPRDVEFLEHAGEIEPWTPKLIAAILCGLCGLAARFVLPPSVAIVGYLTAYLAGSWYTAEEVWERLQKRAIDVHFLMLAVAAGSACIGAWGEGTTLLFLFSLSGALEHFALGRTEREIRSLFREAPKSATVLDESGHERELQVERLRPGMRLLIKPGAQFPVDAEVAKGQTASDESNLTGEAAPVEKGIGDTVLAGTMNLWGAVEAIVLRPAAESSLQKIIHLIHEAQRRKAPAQQFTDRFSSYYTYIVLGLSFAMFFVWWLGFGQAPFASKDLGQSAFYHTMTLLVVASPCALVLSIPSAVLAAIAWSARHGILFRGGAAVEKLAGITTVALDKTGTLTTGELRVERTESFPSGREAEVAQLAYSLERLSTHPLARAITRYSKQQGLEYIELRQFESVTGQGLRAWHDGHPCFLGRRSWVEQNRAAERDEGAPGSAAASNTASKSPRGDGARTFLSAATIERSTGQEFSTTLHPPDLAADKNVRAPAPGDAAPSCPDSSLCEIWLASGDLLGRISLRDDIRPQSRAVVEDLRREGLRTVVLTGDRKSAANALRTELKVDDVRAELKPEEKLSEIRSMTSQGQRVAMVGDGVNDAPSLAAAHIGVAMGARGADAALEQADVVLMHDRLENFLAAFRLSQRARRIIRQNLFISLGTVVVLVVLALLRQIPLTLGVVGHEGSTVVVVMNSLRLLFGGNASGRDRSHSADAG